MGDGDAPPEWRALQVVDRFGVLAAFGRQPTPREMWRMLFIERCARAWAGMEQAKTDNLAKWASEHKDEDNLVKWLIRISHDGE